jgi:ubiquinone/menaquinone biosynthesis C-methylase UbiE
MMATTPPVEDLRRSVIDEQATTLTRARYQRLSAIYDLMEGMAEARNRPWREKLWALVEGSRVLEVGVGTGKNMPCWPQGMQMTAIDLTPGMLEIAHRRANRLGLTADLGLGDAQALEFSDASFDAAVATFVFCSVPDPVLGLRELARVVRPGGQVLLLEHMRSANPLLGALMDFVNPLVVWLMGANINRRTVENVQAAGLQIESVEDLGMGGIFKLIVARVGNGTDLGGPA